MRRKFKMLAALSLCLALAVAMLSGCESGQGQGQGELKTIIIGTHAIAEEDPSWRDSISGEPAMSQDQIRAAELALEKVREELNVQIVWKNYTSDLQQLLLQTVLAGDPFCHLAVMWNGIQGNIMAQNILQPLDKYADVFLDDPDGQWILIDKSFGSYYLLNRDLLFVNTWPLVYNASYIERVPALKENGETVYPSDLYERGEWTWSRFEDYLTKIQAYYSGKMGPVNATKEIVPYNTNYTYTALMAFHANGACVYDGTNMAFDSEEGKTAAEWLDRMMTKGLITCSTASVTSTNAGWLTASDACMNGETVFTNCARWRMDDVSNSLASRGESMGIIPFPRPDSIPAGEYGTTKYQHLSAVADSVGLLKGFSEEESRLALEAYKLYKNTYYMEMGRVDSIAEYMEKQAASEALAFGVDIFHEKIGDANLRIFKELGTTPGNEFAESIGIQGTWGADILGASIFGVNGSPKYAIAIESKKASVYNRLETISKALRSGEVVDNVVPNASKKIDGPIVFPLGTDPSKVQWVDYINANDNVDGTYDLKQDGQSILLRNEIKETDEDDDEETTEPEFEEDRLKLDYSSIDFNAVGEYADALNIEVTDSAGNIGKRSLTVYVYDENSTIPPSLTLKEELPTLAIDTDTSTVDWAGKYVESATDVNGIDLKKNVSADVRDLDVTVPGSYPVAIRVTDFADNVTEQIITITIE